MIDTAKRHETISGWFKEASNYLKSIEKSIVNVSSKDRWNNLVTEADEYIEEQFVERIKQTFPGEKIMSEEGFGDNELQNEGVKWYIDPIDGTTNFVTMRKHYASMLAVYVNGIGQLAYIYNRDEDALYTAVKGNGIYKNNKKIEFYKDDYRLCDGVMGMNAILLREEEYDKLKQTSRHSLGIRSQGSAGLEVLDVALGNQVSFMSTHLAPWDIAPGLVFLNERNVMVKQFNGEDPTLTKNEKIIVAYPSAYSEIINLLNK